MVGRRVGERSPGWAPLTISLWRRGRVGLESLLLTDRTQTHWTRTTVQHFICRSRRGINISGAA